MHKNFYILFILVIILTLYNTTYKKINANNQVSSPKDYIFVTKWGSKGTGDGQFSGVGKVYFLVTDEIIEKFKSKLSQEKLNCLKSIKHKELYWDDFAEIILFDFKFNDKEYREIIEEAAIYKPMPSDGPHDIEVDKEGYVYIPDCYNNRIQKFDSSGKFIMKWGSNGKDNGQFKSPDSIKIDSSGNIYVVDYFNGIQKFDSNGKFITRWGSDNITLCSDGYIYTKEHKDVIKKLELPHSDFPKSFSYTKQYYYIKKFDSNGKFVNKWLELNMNDNNLFYPKYLLGNMESDSEGNIYILLTTSFSVIPEKKLDKVSPWLRITGLVQCEEDLSPEIFKKIGKHPADKLMTELKNMNLDEEEFDIIMKYVEPCAGPGLVVFDSSGSVIKELNIDCPNLTIDSSGNLYVTYRDEHCIKKFDSNGNLITTLGSEGSGDGQFKWPEAVAVDSLGNLYVMDTGNFRVQKFAPNPEYKPNK
jgi:DNA-binding beta-propeller fold protein YncE